MATISVRDYLFGVRKVCEEKGVMNIEHTEMEEISGVGRYDMPMQGARGSKSEPDSYYECNEEFKEKVSWWRRSS